MKKLILLTLFTLFLGSCVTPKIIEVPVDRVKIEYRDRERVDTLICKDSIFIRDSGDTIFQEKYKYIYSIKELRDTISVIDTVTVVNTIEVPKEINKLYNWQVILMILGGISIALGGYRIIKLIKL